MNKRQKKKIRNRLLCRTYKGFEEMKKFIDISTVQSTCFSAKHLLCEYNNPMPFEPYLYNKYGISNEFVKYNRGSTPVQHINRVSPPTVHSGLMDVYMDCYNNHDLEKFDKVIENLSKQLNSPKTFGEDDYFWLLDVIDNATCFNDPIEEVIDYIDGLLTDCGYDVIQVYRHILDKDEFIITHPSENAEICLKAMGVSVAKTIYDFTKEFKDIAKAAMAFHPELVDNKA